MTRVQTHSPTRPEELYQIWPGSVGTVSYIRLVLATLPGQVFIMCAETSFINGSHARGEWLSSTADTLPAPAVAIGETAADFNHQRCRDVVLTMLKSYCVDTTVVLCGAAALVQGVPFSALPPVFFA